MCASSHSFSRSTYAGRQAGVADRVEVQLPLRHAELAEDLGVHLDHLGVDRGIGAADRLDRQLVVLAVAAATGPAVAVHRRDRVRLHRLRVAVQPVLDVGARDRRSSLGAQRERPAAAVVERVHLLVHDVGRIARRAREEPRVLEARRLDAPPAVAAERLLHPREEPPPVGVGRQDVVRPARRLERLGASAALGAEVAQERIRLQLALERRRRAVPRDARSCRPGSGRAARAPRRAACPSRRPAGRRGRPTRRTAGRRRRDVRRRGTRRDRRCARARRRRRT